MKVLHCARLFSNAKGKNLNTIKSRNAEMMKLTTRGQSDIVKHAAELMRTMTADGWDIVPVAVRRKTPLLLFGTILGLVLTMKVGESTQTKLCTLSASGKLLVKANVSNLQLGK